MSVPGTPPRGALVATLDTKGDAARYLAQCIRTAGAEVTIVDVSLTAPGGDGADVPRDTLVAHGAIDAAEHGRPAAMEAMATAAQRVLDDLRARGGVDGAIGIGGGTGGWISQTAFDTLPFGFPRLVVTTVVKASGEHDTLFLPSVVDVAGLSGLLQTVLRNAAGAIAGMVHQTRLEVATDSAPRPSIAMTMFGVTTAGGDIARETLERAGYDVVVFHATGAGGRTLERLVGDGHFAGVLDWTTTELVQHAVGGLCDAGQDRMHARGGIAVPRVVVPGAVDVINVHPPIPDQFADRAVHWHLPTVPLVRSNADETAAAGRWVGEALRQATVPSLVLVPEGGFSAIDVAGGEFADPETDRAFADGVREAGGDAVEVRTHPGHINDPEFAREAANALLALLADHTPSTADKE